MPILPSNSSDTQSGVTKTCSKCLKTLPLTCFSTHKRGKHGRQSICKECDNARAKLYLQDADHRAKRKQTTNDWYSRNKDLVRAQKRQSFASQRAKHLLWEAKRRAERKGVPFGLTEEDAIAIQAIIDAGVCEITGTPFDMSGSRKFNSPSLDRIKPKLGYVRGNVRVVCRAMNIAMSNWGEDDVWEMFQNWARKRSEPAN